MAVLLANVRSTFFINFKQICGNGLGRLSENPPGWMILSFFNFTLADEWIWYFDVFYMVTLFHFTLMSFLSKK